MFGYLCKFRGHFTNRGECKISLLALASSPSLSPIEKLDFSGQKNFPKLNTFFLRQKRGVGEEPPITHPLLITYTCETPSLDLLTDGEMVGLSPQKVWGVV